MSFEFLPLRKYEISHYRTTAVKGKSLLQFLHLCSGNSNPAHAGRALILLSELAYNNVHFMHRQLAACWLIIFLHRAALVRWAILLLCCTAINIPLTGCSTIYRNYVDQKIDSADDVEKARATRGSINVILLPGCANKPGAPDTLFSCLKLSRDVNPESVKLPPDEKIYLGHIAEFILRSLKHYQLQESFKDFYGCRIILKFRKLTPQEMRSEKFAHYSGIVVGTAGTIAGIVTLIPLNVILFLVDGVKTEIDRREFAERVAKMGLPLPKKGAVTQKLEEGGRTLLYVKDEIGKELTGKASARIQFDDKITSYLVEECIMEKVTLEEMKLYQEQVSRWKKM